MQSLVPPRPEARLLLVCVLIAAVAQGMALPFLFVYLTAVRGFDPTVAGLVGGWLGVVSLALAVPAGALADRWGARRTMVAAIVLYSAGVAGYAGVHHPWQALVAATFASLGGAPLLGSYNALLAMATPEEEQQRFFALAFAVLNLGVALGGVAGGFIADIAHPSTFVLLYLCDAGGLLAVGALVAAFVRSGGPSLEQTDHSGRGNYRSILADRRFRRFLIVTGLLVASSYAQFEFGFTAFALDVVHVSTHVMGWAFATNAAAVLVVQLGLLSRIERWRRTTMLAGSGLVVALSWVLLGLAGLNAHHHDMALVLLLSFPVVFAVGEVLLTPVLSSLTNDLAPDELRGRYNALSAVVFGSTEIIGPITAAPLIGHGHAAIWTPLVASGAVVAAAASLLILRPVLTAAQDLA